MIGDDGGYDRYTVGIVTAIWPELKAMRAMLDEEYDELPPQRGDNNSYTLGKIGQHYVAIVCLDAYGTTRAAVATSNMHRSFPNIQVFLMVGVCGGVWKTGHGKDVRLGDVIVSKPEGNQSGIVKLGAGKETKSGFQHGATLNKPPIRVLNAINKLQMKLSESPIIQDHIDSLFQKHPNMSQKQSNMNGSFSRPPPHEDRLFNSDYDHVGEGPCDSCDLARLVARPARENQVEVWYGSLGSDDKVMKDAKLRDTLAEKYKLLGFEMEAAGMMDDFNCTVVRGVCDYSDSHKNKQWQGFAAVAAAAYTKALLMVYMPRRETVLETSPESRRRSSVIQPFLRSETSRRMSAELGTTDTSGDASNKSPLEQLKGYRDKLLLTNPLDDLEHIGAPVCGTCEWVTASQAFQQWQMNGPPLLWISGRPGRGKTMISSFLIRNLPLTTYNEDRVLYFFCSDVHETRSDEILVLKGLLGQIADNACSSEQAVHSIYVLNHFDRNQKTLDYFSSVDALWRTLVDMLMDTTLGYTYCIIDGLNECSKSHELLERIERLVHPKNLQPEKPMPRFIFTSQETQKLRNLSLNGQCKQLDLDDEEHGEYLHRDIQILVATKLQQELQHIPGFQEDLEQELNKTLVDRAEGSFIYINYMIRDLREENTRAGVRAKIDQPPTGIDGFLKRILLRIKDKTRFTTTTQILRFVAIAIRPLSRAEVGAAAKVFALAARKAGDNSNTIYPDDSVDEFLKQCSPLLIERSGYIVFFHHSAKNFLRDKALLYPDLEQFHMDAVQSNLRVAQFCLKYIFRSPLTEQPAHSTDDKMFRDWPCLQYAVAYWHEHARRAGNRSRSIIDGVQTDPILLDPVKSMLNDDDVRVRRNWWQTKIAIQTSRGNSQIELMLHSDETELVRKLDGREEKIQFEMDKATPPLLHMFCRIGLLEWVRKLIEQLSDVKRALESLDSYGVPPLMWAAMEGHLDVAEFLLKNGADPGATCAFHQTTGWSGYKLYRSGVSYYRHFSNSDATWTGNHSPLYRAAYRGHVNMVRLLLRYNADPNLLEWANLNTVHAAVSSGNAEVLDVILEETNRASINGATKVRGHTPLLFAVRAGYVEMARELIHHGAKLNTATWTNIADSVLQLAIREHASTEMLNLLLENCSKQLIDERVDGHAAIHLATEQQDHAVIELLKSYGADIDRTTLRDQDTALHIAVKRDDIDTVECLLYAGANIEAANLQGKTALHVAAERGFEQAVLTLIEHDANVEAEDLGKSTPLHLAVTIGRVSGDLEVFLDTIDVLIHNGAPVNAQNWKGQTPLDKAANRDCLPLMNLLHEHDGMLHRPNFGVRSKNPKLTDPAQRRPVRLRRAPRLSKVDSQRWSSKDSLLTIKSIENDSESGSEKSATSSRSHHRLSFRRHGKSGRDESPGSGKITSNPIVQEPPSEPQLKEAGDVEQKNFGLSLEGVQGRDTL